VLLVMTGALPPPPLEVNDQMLLAELPAVYWQMAAPKLIELYSTFAPMPLFTLLIW
jgi:hypothetical protein